MISLILKGDKDKQYPTNWRHLTLLDTFYKLISAVLAKRLKHVLDMYLADLSQNYIFQHAKENNLPGMMLMINFKNAFDSVGFKFIMTTLEISNFGEKFKEWIKRLLGMNDYMFLICDNQ